MSKKTRARGKQPRPDTVSGREPAPCATDIIHNFVNADGDEVPDGFNRIGYRIVDNICEEHIM